MHLKKLLFLLFAVAMGLSSAQTGYKDLLSIPGPLEFNGTEYYLIWSKEVSPTLSVQQYIPKDESLDNYDQLITISYFNKDIDLEQAIRQKVEMVQSIKKEDKLAKIDVSGNPDGSEFIVDYTLSGRTNQEDSNFVEYSADRFKKYPTGNKPLLIFSYKKRIYGEEQKDNAKALSKQRNELITALIEFKIPNIKLNSTKTN